MREIGIKTRFLNPMWVSVVWGHYVRGGRSLTLLNRETGEPVMVVSLWAADSGISDNEIIVKDYGENEGILRAIVQAGLVKDTGRTITVGYNVCSIVKCLDL